MTTANGSAFAAPWGGPMRLVAVAGLASCAIGCMALVGWLAGSIELARPLPHSLPLSFNAALGFCAVGGAFALLGTRFWRLSAVLGLLAAALACAVLVEHLSGLSLGIDEAVWQDRLSGLPAPRGRIPPAEALAIAASGLLVAGWAASVPRGRRRRGLPATLSTFGSLLITIGVVGFAVQVSGFTDGVDTESATRISAPGALIVALLGMALVLLQLVGRPGHVRNGILERQLTTPWTLLPIAAASFVSTLLLWRAVTSALRGSGQPIDEAIASEATLVVALVIAAVLTAAIRYWLVATAATHRLRTEIAGHQRTEAALGASEEQLRIVADHTPDLVARLDRDLRILYLNRNPEGRVGRHYSEMVRGVDLGPGAVDSLLAELDGRLRLALETGAAQTLNPELALPDGRREYEIRIVPERNRGVAVAGLVVLARDVTERRRAEEERRRLEAQILHAQKLESLGVLAGGIAHDFNNMLVAILGNAGLLREQLEQGEPGRREIEDIEAAAQRAAELARQMLAYSGKGRFLVEALDLNRVVREMTHLLHASVTKRALVRREFAADLPTIVGDPTQIRQVVMNLMTNASDAVGASGGEITIRTASVDADAEYLAGLQVGEDLAPGTFVVLEVSDTGTGMDAATAARIFDPFFSTKQTGRGLGLAAVLGIVRGHGGGIRVWSEPGRGSTFTILFPVSPAPVGISAQVSPAQAGVSAQVSPAPVGVSAQVSPAQAASAPSSAVPPEASALGGPDVVADSESGRGRVAGVGAVREEEPPFTPLSRPELAPGSTDGADRSDGAGQPTARAGREARAHRTILVVDDEESIRDVVSRILRAAGYSVLSAADGNAALAVYADHAAEIDAVLLDLTMPGLDGHETFRALRRMYPAVRVLMTSGYTEQSAIAPFAESGLAGFIPKPYRAEDLVSAIRDVVEGSTPVPHHPGQPAARGG